VSWGRRWQSPSSSASNLLPWQQQQQQQHSLLLVQHPGHLGHWDLRLLLSLVNTSTLVQLTL
jgi:hypothetical protein